MPSQWSKRLPGQFRPQKAQHLAFKVKSIGTHTSSGGRRRHRHPPGPNNLGLFIGPGFTRLATTWGTTDLHTNPRHAEPVRSETQRQEGELVAALCELKGIGAREARQVVGVIVGKAFHGDEKAQKWLSLNLPALYAEHQHRFALIPACSPAAASAVVAQAS